MSEEYFPAGSIYPGNWQKGKHGASWKSISPEMSFYGIYARTYWYSALCLKCIFFTDRYFFYSQWKGHSGYEGLSVVVGTPNKEVREKYQMNNGYLKYNTLGDFIRLNALASKGFKIPIIQMSRRHLTEWDGIPEFLTEKEVLIRKA